MLESLLNSLSKIEIIKKFGSVSEIRNSFIECRGISQFARVGDLCCIVGKDENIMCEVVVVRNDVTQILPFERVYGVKIGDLVQISNLDTCVFPDLKWKGRVLNAFAKPIDDKGDLHLGDKAYVITGESIPFHKRNKMGSKINLGTKVIDIFTPCCFGQRLGIFSGSGVGKSILVSMLAKYAKVDVKVIGLIGERSREAKEFIDDYLGTNLANAVIISSTGDESALMKKRAAYLTMTIAEYFRDQGLEVLCIVDSITRFAMAQREIGLAIGEFPVNKGYTPSVFSELPKLLERAGPGDGKSSITALFTVLVEGDDHNEPISDTVRAILDGHIVLNRSIAERGRFPAVDILKSISRSAPRCYEPRQRKIVEYARNILATYQNMEEMIRLGIYKQGTDKEIDLAIKYYEKIDLFLKQMPDEDALADDSYNKLAQILELTEDD